MGVSVDGKRGVKVLGNKIGRGKDIFVVLWGQLYRFCLTDFARSGGVDEKRVIIEVSLSNMEKTKVIERRNCEYSQLIEDFKKKIKGINVQGVTGPHFPGVGSSYYRAKYKFAFCGIETYGWNSMASFMEKSPEEYLMDTDSCLNSLEYLKWFNNLHATFWGFVLKFFSEFYKVDLNDLTTANSENEDVLDVLKSFVWANANSIERFEVSSKGQGANHADWEQVKNASAKFDDLNHIINSCRPKVIFLLSGGADLNSVINDSTLSKIYNIDPSNKSNILKIAHKEGVPYDYYYLRNTDTHLFKLPHPTWMGLYSGIGINKYVEAIIQDLSNYKTWDTLPNGISDWANETDEFVDKSSRDYKFHIIATLAHNLTSNNLVMSGVELAKIFNFNNIKTQYGNSYSEKGGRGIYHVITSAWSYYQYEKKDYQTAYEIARSFVKQNGDYAY